MQELAEAHIADIEIAAMIGIICAFVSPFIEHVVLRRRGGQRFVIENLTFQVLLVVLGAESSHRDGDTAQSSDVDERPVLTRPRERTARQRPRPAPRQTERKPSTSNEEKKSTSNDALGELVAWAVGVFLVVAALDWIYLTFRILILNVVFYVTWFSIAITIVLIIYLLLRDVVVGPGWGLFGIFALVFSVLGLVEYFQLKYPDFQRGDYAKMLADFDAHGLSALGTDAMFFVAYQFIGVVLYVALILVLINAEVFVISGVNYVQHARARPIWQSLNWLSSWLTFGRNPVIVMLLLTVFGLLSLGLSSGAIYNRMPRSSPVAATPSSTAVVVVGAIPSVVASPSVIVAATPTPAPFCQQGQTPEFQFGLAALHDQLGAVMGQPVECEHRATPGGDSQQKTSTDLAYYRAQTNTSSFTTGSQHWALTANGLVQWEGDNVDPPAP